MSETPPVGRKSRVAETPDDDPRGCDDAKPHHDAPRVSYHQGPDLKPVDRQAIPEGTRAVLDAYRDRAAELGAYEVELRDRTGGTFEVVCRHSPDGGGVE